MEPSTAIQPVRPTSATRSQASDASPPTRDRLGIALALAMAFGFYRMASLGNQFSQLDNQCLRLHPDTLERPGQDEAFAANCLEQKGIAQTVMIHYYFNFFMVLACSITFLVRLLIRFAPSVDSQFQKQVTNKLNELNAGWNSDALEIATFRTYFTQKMWNTQEAINNPGAFAEKQLNLLQQINSDAELRQACFALAAAGSSDCHDNTFAMFLKMQEKALEMKMCKPDIPVEQLVSYGLALENQNKLNQLIECTPVLKDAVNGNEGTEALLTIQLLCHQENIILPIPVASVLHEELGWQQFGGYFSRLSRASMSELIHDAIPLHKQPSANFLATQNFWQKYINRINPAIEEEVTVIEAAASSDLDNENNKLFNNKGDDRPFSEVEKNMLAIEQKRKEAVVNVYLEETTRQLEAIEQNSRDS